MVDSRPLLPHTPGKRRTKECPAGLSPVAVSAKPALLDTSQRSPVGGPAEACCPHLFILLSASLVLLDVLHLCPVVSPALDYAHLCSPAPPFCSVQVSRFGFGFPNVFCITSSVAQSFHHESWPSPHCPHHRSTQSCAFRIDKGKVVFIFMFSSYKSLFTCTLCIEKKNVLCENIDFLLSPLCV